MAGPFSVGESLVGEGNEVAHIDLLVGSKAGPVGMAFAAALLNLFVYAGVTDPARLERLFDGSALGQRDKWTKRVDYRRRTIARALDGTVSPTPRSAARPSSGPSAIALRSMSS